MTFQKTYLERSYPSDYSGPYIVNLKTKHSMNESYLGDLFKDKLTENDSYHFFGKNNISVNILSREIYEKFRTHATIKEKFDMELPSNLTEVQGVITVEQYYNILELIEECDEQHIVNSCSYITRVEYQNSERKIIKTNKVILNINLKKLPEEIKLDSINFKITPYIPRIKMCKNCHRFGHWTNLCKSKARCLSCGGNHDAKECTSSRKCLGCNGSGHLFGSKLCPQFTFLKSHSLQLHKRQVTYKFLIRQYFSLNGNQTYGTSRKMENSTGINIAHKSNGAKETRNKEVQTDHQDIDILKNTEEEYDKDLAYLAITQSLQGTINKNKNTRNTKNQQNKQVTLNLQSNTKNRIEQLMEKTLQKTIRTRNQDYATKATNLIKLVDGLLDILQIKSCIYSQINN
jgi:hypothetical protein